MLAIPAALFVHSLARPPRNFPTNIPVIPFYVAFITLFKKVDQEWIYHRYLQQPLDEHGAVIIYFASRWNILLQRPEYLAEMFKDISLYEKSGNQKKIPYSILADYTGDNIISAHGDTWRTYRRVMQPGLQKTIDAEPLERNARLFVNLIQDQVGSSPHGKSMPVQQLIQRFTLANVSDELLGIDLETLKRPDAPLHMQQLAVKKEIFKPLYMNFAFLDALPIPSRVAARKMVHEYTANLVAKIKADHAKSDYTDYSTVGSALVNARENGVLTEKQFRDNASIVFIAGHENPQLLITSLLYLLAKDQSLQTALRTELANNKANANAAAPLKDLPLLNSFIYETLRMYPPLSQIINRKTSRDTVLANSICIPRGTYVGYTAYGNGRDQTIWGPTAEHFNPARWGATPDEIARRYKHAKSKAHLIAFHGGARACLGERLALAEIRIVLEEMLGRLKWSLDPEWHDMMTPAGPLCPLMLKLHFETIQEPVKA